MLESVYESLLAGLLERDGHKLERQLAVGFSYAEIEVPQAIRVDL